MAEWVQRPRADGTIVVQIRWRQDGRYHSESFTNVRLAIEFRTAVEAAGNQWPTGWIRGEGWAPAPAAPRVLTFADVATGEEGYFVHQQRRVKRGKLTPYTVHRDRRAYELHFEETFGHLPFVNIDEHDVTDWVDTQLDDGAAPKSIRNRHGLLSSIMKHGRLRLKLRPDNPCELSELPDVDTARSEARQIRFFQQHEWALLRAHLAEDIRLALDVDLATGLRWGELSALRVGDLTFAGDGQHRQANLHVVRAWSRRSPHDPARIRTEESETGRWILGPPKSRRSRWVVATGPVAERLEREVAGRPRDAYVFLTPQGNPWRYPDFHTRRWTPAKDAARKAGLDKAITPHMLRHTTVVWSLASGVPIQVISEMIGHTSLQMTYDVYGGLVNLNDPGQPRRS
jgi:integrase